MPTVLVETVFDIDFFAVLIDNRTRVRERICIRAICLVLFDQLRIVELIEAVAVFVVGEDFFVVVCDIRSLRIRPALVEDKTEDDRHGHTAVHLRVEQKRIVKREISVLVETVVVLLEQGFESRIVEAFFQHSFIIEVCVDIIENRKRNGTSRDVVLEGIVVVVEDILVVDELVKFIFSLVGFECVDFGLNTFYTRLFIL